MRHDDTFLMQGNKILQYVYEKCWRFLACIALKTSEIYMHSPLSGFRYRSFKLILQINSMSCSECLLPKLRIWNLKQQIQHYTTSNSQQNAILSCLIHLRKLTYLSMSDDRPITRAKKLSVSQNYIYLIQICVENMAVSIQGNYL